MGSTMFGKRSLSLCGPLSAVRRILRGFRHDDQGVTAIEFGLVAMPFFALLFAIIETALTFWTTQVLETAVSNASRQIYTGQFQTANTGTTDPTQLATKFRDEVCKSIVALFACSSVKVDVRSFASFPSQNAAPPITTDKQFDSANFGKYEAPGANQIVVVRAAVEYPVFVSMLNPNQANLANGNRLLMGTATFRTEPFS
jgi:Flp pilus assembly protein TadG